MTGTIESDETGWWFRAAGGALAALGLDIGQTADAFLRADL